MKAHSGVGTDSGLARTLRTTGANTAAGTMAHALLHDGEEEVQGDAGYQGAGRREEHRNPEVDWRMARKPGQRRRLAKDGPAEAAEQR